MVRSMTGMVMPVITNDIDVMGLWVDVVWGETQSADAIKGVTNPDKMLHFLTARPAGVVPMKG